MGEDEVVVDETTPDVPPTPEAVLVVLAEDVVLDEDVVEVEETIWEDSGVSGSLRHQSNLPQSPQKGTTDTYLQPTEQP